MLAATLFERATETTLLLSVRVEGLVDDKHLYMPNIEA